MTSQSDESAAHSNVRRFALRPAHIIGSADGAWWPSSRRLEDELGSLLDLWPEHEGTIVRVLYSPPDWDDRPLAIATRGRRIKTGGFPNDESHEIVLSLLGGEHCTLSVIPMTTPSSDAQRIFTELRQPPTTKADEDNEHLRGAE